MKASATQRQLLGKHGEQIAVDYLKKHGFSVIARNFKARYGEIDIVALEKDILVFVEVKTRLQENFGKPEEAVTPRKLREVIKTSEYFILHHPELPKGLRIDVIGIELSGDKITYFNHIRNVTG